MSENDAYTSGSERLEIGLTDYEKPLFCSGCEREFDADETLYVEDLGSAFPTFCSDGCAFDKAVNYRVEHLVDDSDGTEFVRLVEQALQTDNE